MKKISLLILACFCLISCGKEANFTLTGNVDGLKKGTLYLQRLNDTIVEDVDSLEISGDSDFTLQTNLKEPEILFLYLDKVDGQRNDDIIEFFAEKGEMQINTSLKNFTTDATINGSKNQEKLNEYNGIIKRFNNQHLDLIKEDFEAQQKENEDEILAVNKKYDQLLKRKYLYTINFAITNKNYEIAPYITIREVFDANVKYLDTVYNSLPKEIRKSKYGKELKDLLKERKKLNKLDKKVEKQNK
ncbi:DUF4369 domain-containing protein [Mesonia aquimarina]|uniref:DUF4369 domain-containing protein n=1 Tax=Mesonia aquimarina TaxID=1504967 RepID=UPI000EF5DF4C|nr:DUF4369 domain-containing protein [Mesonia aquimarina]